MGEEEWYFFCYGEKRYPTGQRTNRGTKAGYWKATGKDKEIYSGKFLVGKKKTLVFYRGRAPKGVKSNWVIHEYRLDGKYSNDNLPDSAQSQWVISRVFHKNSSGKKTHISALPWPNSQLDDVASLPPLTDFDTKPSDNQPPSVKPENPDPTSSSSSFPFPCFPDHRQVSDSLINQDQYSILKLLIDDHGGGGGVSGDDETIDVNSLFSY